MHTRVYTRVHALAFVAPPFAIGDNYSCVSVCVCIRAFEYACMYAHKDACTSISSLQGLFLSQDRSGLHVNIVYMCVYAHGTYAYIQIITRAFHGRAGGGGLYACMHPCVYTA